MRVIILAAIVVFAGVWARTPSASQTNLQLPVPVPQDLRVVSPGTNVPAERVAFSGVWVGKWGNVQDHVVAVEEITESRVVAVYAWGATTGIPEAGWVRDSNAQFVGDELKVSGPRGPATYRMRTDGRLDALFRGPQRETRAIMLRVYPPIVVSPSPGPATAPAQAGLPITVQLPAPLPPDLRIVPPSSAVPADRAAFSGVWVGKWDNTLDTVLAVHEIGVSSVSAVYAWGVAPAWGAQRAGYERSQARFVSGTELHVQTAILAIYRMRSDGRLDAEVPSGTRPRALMTKVFPK